jgi:hypothetical protein
VSAILVLADEDDLGVSRLVTRLRQEHQVKWWPFGGAETAIAVDATPDRFCLSRGDECLTSDDFAGADLVICKRRWLQPRPMVRSGLLNAADRRFAEREWRSLLDGLLAAQERRCEAVWLNAPSAWARTANKLSLMLRAVELGLPVPAFRISTPLRRPGGDPAADLVAKAISADEEIEPSRHFSTVKLGRSELAGLLGQRVTTPSLLQEHVEAVGELRAYFVLGEFVTVRLQSSAEHVDIRHATRDEMRPRLDRLPAGWAEPLGALAQDLGLGYCAFDLVERENGGPALVDVTPAGSWDYFETPEDPFLSCALAKAVESRLVAMMAGRT